MIKPPLCSTVQFNLNETTSNIFAIRGLYFKNTFNKTFDCQKVLQYLLSINPICTYVYTYTVCTIHNIHDIKSINYNNAINT